MSVLAACIHGCLVKIQTGTRTRRVASIGQPGGFNWEQRTMGPPGKGQRIHVRYGMPEDLEDIFGGGGAFSDFFASICGGMGDAWPSSGREGYTYRPRPGVGRMEDVFYASIWVSQL